MSILISHHKGGIYIKNINDSVKKHLKTGILPALALILTIVLDSVNPFLNRMIIDKALPSRSPKLLLTIVAALVTVTVLRALFGFVKEYLFDRTGTLIYGDLKTVFFDHIQTLSFRYFDNINTGEIMSRMGEDIENIWRSFAFGFRLVAEEALYFILGVTILGYINIKLTLLVLLVLSPIVFLAVKLEKKTDKNFEEISDQTASMNTTAQENIAGVRLVKAFAREKHEIGKFFSENEKNFELNNEGAVIMGHYFPIIELLTNISVIVMIFMGAYFVIHGQMTLGDLAVFSGFIWNLIWPLREIGWLMNMWAQFNASSKKVMAIFSTEAEIKDEGDIPPMDIIGGVEFDNVTFAYNDEKVLKDVSFKVNPGDTVALMGTTGSGKSSVVSLIGRYYEYQEGSVKVDGTDNHSIRLKDLRSAMSIVPQDTFLFSESILNNLKFGAGNPSDEEISEAIRIACAEFVYDFEEGLDTVIGERGVGLSGGQKQRIAIARAIIRRAPILVLDDATSALDMDTEYELLKNLKELDRSRTTFIIAHRISAVKNADRILYLDDGRIKESGTHDELVALKGSYYEIYKDQFRDFEDLEVV